MKRLLLILALAIATLSASALRQPVSASGPLKGIPPLLNCPDVDGDGQVLTGDILQVVNSYFDDYPGPDYMYLNDITADGLQRIDDVLLVVGRYFEVCPLVETQVAQATLAVERYRDQDAAIADGYVQVTQNIAGHGIHWLKASLMDGVFDPAQPEGLNYSLDGELLAVFYVDPMWLPGHEQPPEGFDGMEDMWHHHKGLCQWQGPDGPMVAENVAQADCLALPGGIWFEAFGWMLHLWNFLPNMMGRFMMENPDAG